MENFDNVFPVAVIYPILHDEVFDRHILSTEFCFLHENSQPCDNSVYTLNSVECPIFNSINPFELNKLSIHDSHNDSKKLESAFNYCPCIFNVLDDKPLSKIKFKCDILLYSIIIYELKRSKTFRLTVMKKFFLFSQRHLQNSFDITKQCLLCNKRIFYFQIRVLLSEFKNNILDYKWNKRLEIMINERCELENAMAWLSTLGGAFSALGDYFLDCAKKAGLISMQQLRLALKLGDPITICQCKIYLAMSLLQRGYYTTAKDLIRDSYLFSIGHEGSKDFRLKNMCIAVWNKLKYVLSEKKKKQLCHKYLT